MAEKKLRPLRGLTRIAYAVRTVGSDGTVTYGVPKEIPMPKRIAASPSTTSNKYYAGSELQFNEDILEHITIAIGITDLQDEDIHILLGHKLATEGGYIVNQYDAPTEVAILIEAKKAFSDDYRYVTYFKGTFSEGEETIEGEEGSANYQGKTLNGTFSAGANYKYVVDTDSPGASATLKDTFFKSVVVPTPKTVTREAQALEVENK